MKTYWLLMLGMGLVFLALFGLVEALHVPLLTNPQPFLDRAGLWGAAATGAGLLVADVFLPVPASLVMVADGALFGILGGTLVSLAGSMGGAALGFASAISPPASSTPPREPPPPASTTPSSCSASSWPWPPSSGSPAAASASPRPLRRRSRNRKTWDRRRILLSRGSRALPA